MKIKVLNDRNLIISKPPGTQHENDFEIINFEFPSELQNYNKKIVFIINNQAIWDLIEDNQYTIKTSITQYNSVDFYIWVTHEDIDFRSKTYTLTFYDNKDASSQITPEEINAVNRILAEVDERIEETNNLNIAGSKQGNTTTITITHKDNTTTELDILDGEQGEPGQQGKDGYTPQREIDYWTSQDKQEIINEINSKLTNYFNQPFATFNIDNNGHLKMEVKEFVNTN